MKFFLKYKHLNTFLTDKDMYTNNYCRLAIVEGVSFIQEALPRSKYQPLATSLPGYPYNTILVHTCKSTCTKQ